MSKLTKLIGNPQLFVKDMLRNQIYNVSEKVGLELEKKYVSVKSRSIKKSTLTLDISALKLLRRVPLIIHSGENMEAGSNQLLPWISIFSQAVEDYVILVRNEALYRWVLTNFPSISVVLAKSAAEVEEVIKLLPDTKYIFYPSSTGNNIHLVRFNHLRHIFIGHGDSDKQSSAHKALRLYDEVWTAGQAHIDRFKNMEFDTAHIRFLKVGRPNMSQILELSKNNWRDRMSSKVLYLPTWEGVIEDTNYSSTHISFQVIREVINKFNIPITIKYHPFTGSRNKILSNINNLTHDMINEDGLVASVVSHDTDVSSVIPYNNIFICDISGVVTECLAANSPIFVYIPSDRTIVVAKSNMGYEDYCYTYSSIPELLEKMEIVLNGNDYLAKQREKAIDYFLGYHETLEKRFIEQIRSINTDKVDLKYIPRLFEEL